MVIVPMDRVSSEEEDVEDVGVRRNDDGDDDLED